MTTELLDETYEEEIDHLTYCSYLAQRRDWLDPHTASDKVKKILTSWYPRMNEYEKRYQRQINMESK